MSWFVADPTRPISTRRIDLGPCGCPGAPHESDWIDVYEVIAWDDLVDVAEAGTEGAARRRFHARAIHRWSFIDAEGRPVPVSEDTVRLLSPAALDALAGPLAEVLERSRLPNGRGAPSPRSRRGSASSPQTTTRTPGSSSSRSAPAGPQT